MKRHVALYLGRGSSKISMKIEAGRRLLKGSQEPIRVERSKKPF